MLQRVRLTRAVWTLEVRLESAVQGGESSLVWLGKSGAVDLSSEPGAT
jgi:hypothetical protein